MKTDTLNLNTVHECNCILGKKTLHPLVSIINLSSKNWGQLDCLKVGFYAALLNENFCKSFIYGREKCDFSDGTILFFSPGETIEIKERAEIFHSKGWLLTFHPEFITGTSLGMNIGNYTFFNYQKSEALHLSFREQKNICRCMEDIEKELLWSIDIYSKALISKYIEIFLDYCTRFYTRQFTTRSEINKKIINKVEKIIENVLLNRQINSFGVSMTKYCASQLSLSDTYLEDLLKHETGMRMNEYIQIKCINIAKKSLLETNKSYNQIAKDLGFPSSQHFSRLFKRITGITPTEYKTQN